MDRNTLIGLGLIGVILAVFTYINQPTPEEIARASNQQQNDSINNVVLKEDSLQFPNDSINKIKLQTNDSISDSSETIDTTNSDEANFTEQEFVLENNKIAVHISTLGGGVKKVFLKEFQTYDDFAQNGADTITSLKLFDDSESVNQLEFPLNGNTITTSKLPFEVVSNSTNYLELRYAQNENQSISFIYSIADDNYHINYEINMNGFAGSVNPENVFLNWKSDLCKTERLLSEQRRISTIFFMNKTEGYDYLSEASNDQKELEYETEWIAFKQSYFSAIMMPDKPFLKKGATLSVENYNENSPKFDTHIKSYQAKLNPDIGNTGNGSISMKWFFGPNDYNTLHAYQNNADDLINYGWGLFRWVNIYAIQPIFSWLASFGINLGLAILLLTIIVKIALTPIQWKMYSSSAKMKILKPQIDELNKKFPNKEDGMKKQMEMMNLYRESGASPLAGCIPMLIQMPILFAVFRFFPSTFELRQKPFLWAEDLSSYDSILDFGFNLPLYGDHISLFTLLMSGTTLAYTIMNSGNMQQPTQPGMPNMKVIMYIFPIIMIFFFNNYSSGLSYYYFISTLISILTMLMIKRFFVDEEKLKSKMEAKKINNQKSGGKKSRFVERLEEMQKAQQDRLKGRK